MSTADPSEEIHNAMRTHARVVVIGGGVTGCSVLYHLACAGWTDCLLIERSELTSGSTWHAAGGTGALAPSATMTWLHRYSFELYPKLEAETGQSCGFHHVGGVMLARTERRMEEIELFRSKARRVGFSPRWLDEGEARELAPILDLSGVKGVLYEGSRGHVDPSGVTHAFAKGARDRGAEIVRRCPVLETNPRRDGAWEVVTEQGTIVAEHVVNAAGLWAREVAALAGVRLSLMPVEHHYIVTQPIAEIEAMDRELPLIGDADAEYYMRQEGQGLLLGVYESPCTHWAVDGTPRDFGHELLPDDLARMEHNMAQAIESVPVLGRAGIRRVVNGPMIFSPDLNPLVGPLPGLRNYWCACGVMTAFSQAGAVGKVLTEWMTNGDPGLDFFMWDVTRYGDWAGRAYTMARTADMYSTRFRTHYPYEEREAGRPVRTTPVYPLLKEAGAVFGASWGYEYPLWYAPDGTKAEDELTFRRPNWFGPVGEEARAVRAALGLFETSTFGKFSVRGPGARAWLDRVMANRMPREDGRIVLTPMLNEAGRIIGDFSVARLGPDEYFLVGAGSTERFHLRWWERWLPASGVALESMMTRLAGFAIAGPRARDLLARLADRDVSNGALAFFSVARMQVGPAPDVIVLRVSYSGELGYELYLPPEHQVPLFLALRREGAGLGLRLAGMRALGSLRLEKGFPGWGRELSPDYDPFQAGLGRFVGLDKHEFVGRDAALRAAGREPEERLVLFEIDAGDSAPGADPWGGEPVLRDGEYVGYLTSAGYGHCAGRTLALGYVRSDAIASNAAYDVEVIGEPRPARRLERPPIDPEGERMRG